MKRSTWLGLVALATVCGASIVTAVVEQIIIIGMAIVGLIGVVAKDKTETKKKESDNG